MKNTIEEIVETEIIDAQELTESNNIEESQETAEESNTESPKKDRYIFQYILSLIVPLIAFILGALLLTRDEKETRFRGKMCFLMGIINIYLFIIISRL